MIYEKLFNIQQNLNAPKNLRNNFGNYNYRSCDGILEALKPLLKANNCVILFNDEIIEKNSEVVSTKYDENGNTYVNSAKNRIYIKTTLSLVDVETQETVSVTAEAREEETKKGMDGSQITGASSSYARKYALNALFAIDDNKDSDETNIGEDPAPKKPKKQKEEPKNEEPKKQEPVPIPETPEDATYRRKAIDEWTRQGNAPALLAQFFPATHETTEEQWKEIYEAILAGKTSL